MAAGLLYLSFLLFRAEGILEHILASLFALEDEKSLGLAEIGTNVTSKDGKLT